MDSAIVELIADNALTTDFKQAGNFKSEIYATLVRINNTLKLTIPPAPPTPVPIATTHEITPARAPEPSMSLSKLSINPSMETKLSGLHVPFGTP